MTQVDLSDPEGVMTQATRKWVFGASWPHAENKYNLKKSTNLDLLPNFQTKLDVISVRHAKKVW